MRYAALILALASVAVAAAQQPTAKPTTKILRETGRAWITGIAEPSSGRFLVSSSDSVITIVTKATGVTHELRVPTAGFGGTHINVSRSGNLLTYVRPDDGNKGPFAWAQSLDSLTGQPRGAARRVTIVKTYWAHPSSDGRFISFVADDGNHPWAAGGTRLLVVPSAGGTERVLDSADRGLSQPRWSPDDQWIYYRKAPALMRVRAAGGAPDSIGVTGAFIDVSPDGRLLAFYGGPQPPFQMPSYFNFARTDGTIVAQTFVDFWVERPVTWGSSNTSMLSVNGMESVTYKKASIPGGQLSEIPFVKSLGEDMSAEATFQPSPDGKQLAVAVRETGRRIVIFQQATGARKDFDVPVSMDGQGWRWSPNGKFIAFLAMAMGADNSAGFQLHLLDVSTGRTRVIGNTGPQSRIHWLANSEGVLYVARGNPNASGVQSATVRRVGLDGTETVVRELDGVAARAAFRILDDDLVARAASRVVDLISLRSGRATRIHSDTTMVYDYPAAMPFISLSPDKARVAFTVPVGPSRFQLMLASVDGKEHRLIGAPTCDVQVNGWTSGGREILAINNDCASNKNGHVIIALDGSAPRAINIPHWPSPVLYDGGRSAIVAEWGVERLRLTQIDFSSVLRSGAR